MSTENCKEQALFDRSRYAYMLGFLQFMFVAT